LTLKDDREKTVKLFSSALKRTLRSGASGLSIAAAASIQQKPAQKKNSASLLVRSAERRMHSKVVSEFSLQRDGLPTRLQVAIRLP
jgi:hypothetical protein